MGERSLLRTVKAIVVFVLCLVVLYVSVVQSSRGAMPLGSSSTLEFSCFEDDGVWGLAPYVIIFRVIFR